MTLSFVAGGSSSVCQRTVSVPRRRCGHIQSFSCFVGLLQPDDDGWSEDRHPWFEYTIKLSPREPDQPGQIKFDQTPKLTMRNAKNCTELQFEHRGPDVPNPVRIEDIRSESNG